MTPTSYDDKLRTYIFDNFNDYKGDLFSVFMYKNFEYCKADGYCAFMTPNVWMFIASYDKLRDYIINQKSISTLVQMAKGAFFKEATVDVAAFVLRNNHIDNRGMYFRLERFKGDMEVQGKAFCDAVKDIDNCKYAFYIDSSIFTQIPGRPIAYWVSNKMLEAFQTGKSFGGNTKKGVLTGNNARFTRLWHEVDFQKMGLDLHSHEEMISSKKKWFPVTSGGQKRKWYGNFDTIVNLENDGQEIKQNVKNYRLRDPQYYMLEAITWTEVSSGLFACRYVPSGILFGNGGPVSFFHNGGLKYHLGLLNSNTTMSVMEYLAPTVNYGPEQISKIPLIEDRKDEVEAIVKELIEISKKDWDSFETSWDFKIHPLMPTKDMNGALIKTLFETWEDECENRFNELKLKEEELNNIFIGIYGLEDELAPEVLEKDVTVNRADKLRDVKSLISYAVGCMFGRYAVNSNGLVFAGGKWDDDKYSTFIPDKDAIIPICDDEYFDDDMTNLFIKFIERIYGKENLDENLSFIADAIGGKGTPRQIIRNYFINEFFSDHCKMYQKKPIYWLFDSGKKNGFKCLIYMHRYQSDTLARIRTDYVHEQQSRYKTAISEYEQKINSAEGNERVQIDKKLKTLREQDDELHKYEEKIHHLADQMISIDLDDGVKVNYEIFGDVLSKIK